MSRIVHTYLVIALFQSSITVLTAFGNCNLVNLGPLRRTNNFLFI